MKTPREVFLERHRSMEPKLDGIREQVVAQLRQPARASVWDKPVMPLRWHLAGIAAAWIVIAVLNTEQPTDTVRTTKASSPGELVIAMQENRRQLLELTEAADVTSADRLKPALQLHAPRRRSEAVPSLAAA